MTYLGDKITLHAAISEVDGVCGVGGGGVGWTTVHHRVHR